MPLGRRLALAGLLVWTSSAWCQRPSAEEASAAIEKSRQKALDYSRSLPDFVCTELIHRFIDPRVRAVPTWRSTDTLTIRLSYFQQVEDHKLMRINGFETDRAYDSLDGATGVGEFGGMLHSIFDPVSQAAFRWESWKTVRKHRAAVYNYTVAAGHSQYLLVTGAPDGRRQAVVGYHGMVEIDSETGEVLEFNYQADQIPKTLDLSYAMSQVEYSSADIGGREYLLPARSRTEMRSSRLAVKNEIEFQEYRKFSSESTITFGEGK